MWQHSVKHGTFRESTPPGDDTPRIRTLSTNAYQRLDMDAVRSETDADGRTCLFGEQS